MFGTYLLTIIRVGMCRSSEYFEGVTYSILYGIYSIYVGSIQILIMTKVTRLLRYSQRFCHWGGCIIMGNL